MFFTSSQSRRCKLFSDLTLRWESSPAPSLNYSHSDLSIKPQRSERTLECCPLGHAPLVLIGHSEGENRSVDSAHYPLVGVFTESQNK